MDPKVRAASYKAIPRFLDIGAFMRAWRALPWSLTRNKSRLGLSAAPIKLCSPGVRKHVVSPRVLRRG